MSDALHCIAKGACTRHSWKCQKIVPLFVSHFHVKQGDGGGGCARALLVRFLLDGTFNGCVWRDSSEKGHFFFWFFFTFLFFLAETLNQVKASKFHMSDSDELYEDGDGSPYSSGEEDGYEEMDENGYNSDNQGGMEENGEPQQKRQKTSNKFALPTKEEQMHLRETENLMRTNLLKLQVDEMLGEVRDDKGASNQKFLEWLASLVDSLGSLSCPSDNAIDEAWLHRNGVHGIELENYAADLSSGTYIEFDRPESVDVVGSFKHQTATKPYLNVDIAVTMPLKCLDAR